MFNLSSPDDATRRCAQHRPTAITQGVCLALLSVRFSAARPMGMLDVYGVEVSGDVGAVQISESVRWIDGDQRRSVRAASVGVPSSLSHSPLDSTAPILCTTTSQFPATIRTIMFSKTEDIHVMEKPDQSFLTQGPGDVTLGAYVAATRILQSMVAYLFIVAGVGRVCSSGVDFTSLTRPTPRNCRIGSRWSDRRAPYGPVRTE